MIPPSEIYLSHSLPSQKIFGAVKASLERLQLDYIDVLQCGGRYLVTNPKFGAKSCEK